MIQSRKIILLIDDDVDYLFLLKETLESNYFKCLVASSPQEGIELAKTAKPNLILLDLMLPVMSGYGVIRMLKQVAELRNIPIVALTALADEEIAMETIRLGAVGFLNKSCDTKELVNMVSEYAAA
jgi:CheY-like chemotaxis protein